jgi:hypothetical protein
MALFVRSKEVKRAFADLKAALEDYDVDTSDLQLIRHSNLRGPDRFEIQEHGHVVLPCYVIKNAEPHVGARGACARDALRALTFAHEVLQFVQRRRLIA